jgi:hypothetical protein
MNLEEIAPLIEENIKKALAEKRYPFGVKTKPGLSNKIASSSLYNSVEVKQTNNDTLEVLMNEYWKYVQSGVVGGKFKSRKGIKRGPNKGGGENDSPFIKALIKWIKDRKLRGRDKKGRYTSTSTRSLAFAIRTNIFKFGIAPSNFLDVAIENIFEDKRIIELLGEATLEDLINKIEGL